MLLAGLWFLHHGPTSLRGRGATGQEGCAIAGRAGTAPAKRCSGCPIAPRCSRHRVVRSL